MSPKDAREVLGVSSASTAAELRRAYRVAAKRAHPDSGGDEGAFRQIVDAYRVLQDPQDRQFATAPARSRTAPRPDLEVGPRLALEGGEVDHVLADGRLIRITLPPGLRAGDRVRAAGAELRIYIRAEDGVLVRGDDIWITAKVAPSVLRKGGRIRVETPLGTRSVWVDAKAAERGLVSVEGEGLPARGKRPRGRLYVRLAAAEPGVADSAALALLRRFAAAWAA
jgi:curved DNA-binding protein